MSLKTVKAEWIQIEDEPPCSWALCLCNDGLVRIGVPYCSDGYFGLDTQAGEVRVEFWQEIPILKEVEKEYFSK